MFKGLLVSQTVDFYQGQVVVRPIYGLETTSISTDSPLYLRQCYSVVTLVASFFNAASSVCHARVAHFTRAGY